MKKLSQWELDTYKKVKEKLSLSDSWDSKVEENIDTIVLLNRLMEKIEGIKVKL